MEPVRGQLRWGAWTLQLALVAAATLVLYLLLAIWSDAEEMVDVLASFPGSAFVQVFGLVLSGLALRGLRWHLYTRTLALEIPAGPNVLAFLASFAFTATPGKVGEVVKSLLLLRRYGVRIAHTAGALLIERLMDLVAVLLLALGGVSRIAGGPLAALSSALVLAGLVVFLSRPALHRPLLSALSRVRGAGRLVRALPVLLASSSRLLRPATLALGLGLAVGAWSCEALALHLILDELGVALPVSSSFLAFAVATLLGVVSMLPGGVGGFEAAMVVLLEQLGTTEAQAVTATLLIRLSTLWAVSAVGFLFLGIWFAAFGRREADPEAVASSVEGPDEGDQQDGDHPEHHL